MTQSLPPLTAAELRRLLQFSPPHDNHRQLQYKLGPWRLGCPEQTLGDVVIFAATLPNNAGSQRLAVTTAEARCGQIDTWARQLVPAFWPRCGSNPEGDLHWITLPANSGSSIAALLKEHGPVPVVVLDDWHHQMIRRLRYLNACKSGYGSINLDRILVDRENNVRLRDEPVAAALHAGGTAWQGKTSELEDWNAIYTTLRVHCEAHLSRRLDNAHPWRHMASTDAPSPSLSERVSADRSLAADAQPLSAAPADESSPASGQLPRPAAVANAVARIEPGPSQGSRRRNRRQFRRPKWFAMLLLVVGIPIAFAYSLLDNRGSAPQPPVQAGASPANAASPPPSSVRGDNPRPPREEEQPFGRLLVGPGMDGEEEAEQLDQRLAFDLGSESILMPNSPGVSSLPGLEFAAEASPVDGAPQLRERAAEDGAESPGSLEQAVAAVHEPESTLDPKAEMRPAPQPAAPRSSSPSPKSLDLSAVAQEWSGGTAVGETSFSTAAIVLPNGERIDAEQASTSVFRFPSPAEDRPALEADVTEGRLRCRWLVGEAAQRNLAYLENGYLELVPPRESVPTIVWLRKPLSAERPPLDFAAAITEHEIPIGFPPDRRAKLHVECDVPDELQTLGPNRQTADYRKSRFDFWIIEAEPPTHGVLVRIEASGSRRLRLRLQVFVQLDLYARPLVWEPGAAQHWGDRIATLIKTLETKSAMLRRERMSRSASEVRSVLEQREAVAQQQIEQLQLLGRRLAACGQIISLLTRDSAWQFTIETPFATGQSSSLAEVTFGKGGFDLPGRVVSSKE